MAPKKTSPKKKKKPVSTSNGLVHFDSEQQVDNSEEQVDEDPLAEYRAAAQAASKAIEKEKQKQSAREAHLSAVFEAMDRGSLAAGAGRVDMNDVVEAVAQGTAPLTERAATVVRPSQAVALQLPPIFGRDEFFDEMARVAALMDDATFEANVLGLFSCFKAADEAEKALVEAMQESSR